MIYINVKEIFCHTKNPMHTFFYITIVDENRNPTSYLRLIETLFIAYSYVTQSETKFLLVLLLLPGFLNIKLNPVYTQTK